MARDAADAFATQQQKALAIQAREFATSLQASLQQAASAESDLRTVIAALSRTDLAPADIALLVGLQASYVEELMAGRGFSLRFP